MSGAPRFLSAVPGRLGGLAWLAGLAWSVLIVLAVPGTIVASEDVSNARAAAPSDPYAAWMQGRPAEAVPALYARARDSRDWSAWYDCGLAATAAGDAGHAVAWLLAAHRFAPAQAEPLQALRTAGAAMPATWCEHLGPAGWPGRGWSGVALLGASGLLGGWWLTSRARRRWMLNLGGLAALVSAPGAAAAWHDARAPFMAITQDTALVDSTGAAVTPVRAGMLVRREPQPPWNGRALVVLEDGRRGYVPLSDTF